MPTSSRRATTGRRTSTSTTRNWSGGPATLSLSIGCHDGTPFAIFIIVTITKTDRTFALSERALRMPASPIRKLAPLADAAKSRGTKVYHLNIGQPDIETPACMRDRLKMIDDK